jgi:arylsulfatase A-like enzyme
MGAIKSVDNNLAMVLAALKAKGVLDQTDVIVVSDHGFSTIEKNTDVISDLKHAGFSATDKFTETPKPGDIIVASVSGSVLLYVTGHDEAVTQKLVDFFQDWDGTGVIFTKEKMKGAFTLEQGRLNSPQAPDILVSLRWDEHPNKYGVPGSIHAEIPRKVGQGMHATLSKFDIHNTLVAAGPDFKHGMVDDLPTGNVDVAPTILWLLGVPPAEKPDGRVLYEAIANVPDEKLKTSESTLTEERNEQGIQWHQYLKFTHLGPYLYLDEGNGGKQESPAGTK